jgi:hypothetical protein
MRRLLRAAYIPLNIASILNRRIGDGVGDWPTAGYFSNGSFKNIDFTNIHVLLNGIFLMIMMMGGD